MKIAVVIPNWNGVDLLKPCLLSLKNQTISPYVILVDNGSIDQSVSFVKKHFKEVEVLELDKNYGFAGGVNRGIKHAISNGYEAIALLNNDATVAADWLEQLQNTLESNSNNGIVTSKILSMDKTTLDSTGDFYSIWGVPFPRGREEIDRRQYDSEGHRQVFAASGGASLYRAALFRDIGLFDERFFAYYEDVDISFRAQLAGWKVLYEPKARAYHHIGATSEKLGDFRLYHMYKNFWFLFIKNMPGRLFWRYGWRVFGTFGFKKLQLIKKLKFGVLLKVVSVALWRTPEMFKKRRQIQKNRKVDIQYINSMLYHAPPPNQTGLVKATQKTPFESHD